MTNLLVIKDQIIKIYAKFEAFITPVLKFLLMLFVLIVINSNIGYMTKVKNPAITLIIALLCSFLPLNLMVLFAALVIMLHMYALSLPVAAIVGMIMLLMFVVYFRFTPRDAIGVIITPILFTLKMPYVLPISMGLIGGPTSCVSIALGSVMYYVLEYVEDNSKNFSGSTDMENMASAFKGIIDGIVGNDTMKAVAIAFAITTLIVYLVKRLPINFSWIISIGVGTILEIIVVLVAAASLDGDVSAGGVILGTILGAIIGFIVMFFIFNVDYSRTEHVQFEDDEYYYYVKAVPKLSMEAPHVKVKRINPNQGPARGPQRPPQRSQQRMQQMQQQRPVRK